MNPKQRNNLILMAALFAGIYFTAGGEAGCEFTPSPEPQPKTPLAIVFVRDNENPPFKAEVEMEEAVRELREAGFVVIVTDDDPQDATGKMPEHGAKVIAAAQATAPRSVVLVYENGDVEAMPMGETKSAIKQSLRDVGIPTPVTQNAQRSLPA